MFARERDEARAGGRHILTALFGAANRGGWSRDDIYQLADYMAKKYPWADPRQAAEAAGGGDAISVVSQRRTPIAGGD
jgi:hypothetical protein